MRENMFKLQCFIFLLSVISKVLAVPPAICRAEFRWDDCGQPAKPVMYYWKEGSRCEIGFWKGCLPNPNMFADEYECINTCVFVDRPSARTETEEPETTAETTDHNEIDGNTTHDHNDTNNANTTENSNHTTEHNYNTTEHNYNTTENKDHTVENNDNTTDKSENSTGGPAGNSSEHAEPSSEATPKHE